MAKATATPIEVVTTTDGIRLDLTVAEAKALLAVTGYVGGHPAESPRGDMDAIREALSQQLGQRACDLSGSLRGGVYFHDGSL